MDWRHQAICRDEDPEVFFPVGNTGPALAQIEEAKKICARCPVKEPCLAWALESGQDAGVGLPDDFNIEKSANLGLQIANTLTKNELNGSIRLVRLDNLTRGEISFKVN